MDGGQESERGMLVVNIIGEDEGAQGDGENLQGRWPEIFTQELSIASDRNTKLNKKISLATGCRYTKRKLK